MIFPNFILLMGLVLSSCSVIAPQTEEYLKPRIDLNIILRAIGTPQCMRKCINPFVEDASALWQMKNIVYHTKTLCSSHSSSMECLRAAPYCDMKEIFKTISSSVHYLCHEKAVPFSKMEKCLTGEVDTVMHICDAKCHGRSNLTAFASHSSIVLAAQMGGNIFTVSDQLGGICSSLNCLLSCLTPQLNKVCPLSGWLTLDVLLKPLESVADILERVSTQLKNLISKKLDKRCHFIMNKEELLQLRKGKFIMH